MELPKEIKTLFYLDTTFLKVPKAVAEARNLAYLTIDGDIYVVAKEYLRSYFGLDVEVVADTGKILHIYVINEVDLEVLNALGTHHSVSVTPSYDPMDEREQILIRIAYRKSEED